MTIHDEVVALLVAEFRIDPANLVGDRPLKSYGLDSLALVDVLLLIEEHFEVNLPDDMSDYRTLDDLVALVAALSSPHAA